MTQGQTNDRPADHVSPELAAQLREAGLAWEPAVGDWAWWPSARGRDKGGVGLVIGEGAGTLSIYGRDRTGPWAIRNEDCLWLPTVGQCLQEIGRRGQHVELHGYPVRVSHLGAVWEDGLLLDYQWSLEWAGNYVLAPDLAHVVGSVLLSVLQAERATKGGESATVA